MRKLTQHALLLILILVANIQMARAEQLNLIVNGKAIHLGVPAGMRLNEENWGLGLQYDFGLVADKWLPFATVTGFIDSMDNPSWYAGGGLQRRYTLGHLREQRLNLDAGVIAFLMTREDYKNNRPFPGLLPAFSFGTRRVAVNLTYIPKVHPKLIPLWFFQLKLAL